MIFVTVGTHNQPFTRLMTELERIVASPDVKEEFWVQFGHGNQLPRGCEGSAFLGFDEMNMKVQEARIVITHGGPGSIMMALRYQKVPIVVPRQKEYGEHVDNHQVRFCRRLEQERKIIAVYDIEQLGPVLAQYDVHVAECVNAYSLKDGASAATSPATRFSERLESLCHSLVRKR